MRRCGGHCVREVSITEIINIEKLTDKVLRDINSFLASMEKAKTKARELSVAGKEASLSFGKLNGALTAASFDKLNAALAATGASAAQINRINEALLKANPEVLRAQLANVTAEMRKLGATEGDIATLMKEFEKPAANLSKIRTEVDVLGEAYTALAKGMAALIQKSIASSAAFEQSMAKVKAVSQATGTEFEALRNQALAFGASTKFTAGQAAEAQALMAQSGLKTRDVVAALPGVLTLAAAGQTDLAFSAGITSAALKGFGLASEDTARVADVLAKSSLDTHSNVISLGTALKYVAPVAATMKLSIEEAIAAIGQLSDAGFQGESAGASLRSILESLSSPSKEAAEYLQKLHVSATDSSGSIRPLGDVIGQLQSAFANLTKAQKEDAAATLVGHAAAGGLIALIDQGRTTFDSYTESLKNAGGTAKLVAGTQMDTLSGSTKQLQGALESVGITVGDQFAPAIRMAAEAVTHILSGFNSLSPSLQSAIIAFTTIAPLVAGGVVAFLALKTALEAAKVAITGLGIATNAAFPLIGAISLAVGALAAGAAALHSRYKEAEEATKRFAEANKALNDSLNESPLKRTAGDLEEMRAEISETTQVLQERANIQAKIDAFKPKGIGIGAMGMAMSELREFDKELGKADAKLRDMGYQGAEKAEEAIVKLTRAIEESVPALLSEKRAELESLSAKVQHIDRMEELRDRYVELSNIESLNNSQKEETLSIYKQLKAEYPSLIGEMDEEGMVRINNMSIVNQQIEAEKELVTVAAYSNKAFLENLRNTTAAQLVYVQARVDSYKRLETAMDQIAQSGSLSVDDLITEKQFARANKNIEEAVNEQMTLQTTLADIDRLIASITSGTYKELKLPTKADKPIPDNNPNPNGSGKTPEEIAAELRKEQFEAAMTTMRFEAEMYDQSAEQQIEALQQIKEKHGQYLQESIDDARSLQLQLKALHAQQLKDEEAAAKAEYDVSANWIDMEERRLREKGAAESEIAQMQLDAWTRVRVRYKEDTAEYKAADKAMYDARMKLIKEAESAAKEAEEEHQERTRNATKTLLDNIDKQKKAELDALDEQKRAVASYYDQRLKGIEASERQRSRSELEAEAEKYHLATSEAGQKRYAELTEELRKMDVEDQKSALEEARDAELNKLEQRKNDIESWYNDIKVTIEGFNGDVQSIYAATEDVRFAAFVSTNAKIMAEMARFKQEMAVADSMLTQTVPFSEVGAIAQMKANASAWWTADANQKLVLQKESQALGEKIGAVYVDGAWYKNGMPLFHSGGIAGIKSFRSALTLMPDELTAILRQGEVTLTPAQVKSLVEVVSSGTSVGSTTVHIGKIIEMNGATFEDGTDWTETVRASGFETAELLRKQLTGGGA